jgi:hypothetical protein
MPVDIAQPGTAVPSAASRAPVEEVDFDEEEDGEVQPKQGQTKKKKNASSAANWSSTNSLERPSSSAVAGQPRSDRMGRGTKGTYRAVEHSAPGHLIPLQERLASERTD